jgi:hypothetical protein
MYAQHTCQASGESQAQMWRVFYCLNSARRVGVNYTKPALSFEQQADQPEWHSPVTPDNRRTFAVLTLLQWLLRRIAPQSLWQRRMLDLLKSYPDIPLNLAGFPAAWESSPIWNQLSQTK